MSEERVVGGKKYDGKEAGALLKGFGPPKKELSLVRFLKKSTETNRRVEAAFGAPSFGGGDETKSTRGQTGWWE